MQRPTSNAQRPTSKWKIAAALLLIGCNAFAAEVKISELTALTAPAAGDILPIVDVSANATKGITWANLFQSPTLITPVLGVATATSINGVTISSSTGTVTITNAKTFTVSNTLTLAGTDGSTLNVGAGGTLGSAAFTASTAYAPAAGATSIVTLGTVTAGTWNGSIVAPAYLGTGSSITTKYLRGDGTWQTISGGGDALTSGHLGQFAATTSAQLAGVISNETGSGALVFATSPTISDPTFSGTVTGTYTIGGTPTFPNSVTLDSEWDTIAEIEAALGVNILLNTEMDSIAEVNALVGDGDFVSVLGTQTLTSKTMQVSAALGTDDTLEGTTIAGLNNSGGVTQWDAVYLNGSSAWVAADANGSGTYPCRGLATVTVSTGGASIVMTRGTVRNDAWNWTPGGAVYLSTTAGGLTQTAPSGSGEIVQVVGFALTADILFLNITGEYLTLE